MWEQELAEAKELAQTQETIENVLEEFMNALQAKADRMTPGEKERRAQSHKKLQEAHDHKYGWVKGAMKKRERVLSDPDLVFKKWLERRVDNLFDGRG